MFFLSRLLPGWECEGCGSELYWKTQLLCWGWFPLYLSSLSRCKPTQTSLLRFDTWVLRRFHVLHYLKKVVGGRKQRSAERAHTEAHTQTHTLASRREERQNVRAGSGRVLPVLPSAWRLPRRRVASRRPPRLNSLKMSKHLRGVRAVPGPDNYQPFSASRTLTKTGWKSQW